jgi:small subunit ribosomal protein S3
MTHTVHPYAHRLGKIRDWKSRWFSSGKEYADQLRTDVLLREYIDKKLKNFYVSSVEMERKDKQLRIIIKTSRPGLIIGRSGEGVVKLKKDIEGRARKWKLAGTENIKIDIEEIRVPESDATIVGKMIAEGLEKRMPFRRVLKQTVDKVMASRDVKGVRIALAGRLGGADMARKEEIKKGRIPLQTIRADIDFAKVKGKIPQGDIGIKVWIYRGDIFDKQ